MKVRRRAIIHLTLFGNVVGSTLTVWLVVQLSCMY